MTSENEKSIKLGVEIYNLVMNSELTTIAAIGLLEALKFKILNSVQEYDERERHVQTKRN